VRVHISKLVNLASGAIDGLSYPFAVVLAGPIIVHMSGTNDYSKVAAVILMSSVGALFNIVGAQGVIYSLARDDMSASRRSNVLTATLIVTISGMLLFSGCLVFISRLAGIRLIFHAGEITSAAAMSWLLCFLISLDNVFGGVLKARRLISISAAAELIKITGLLIALSIVASHASWRSDCACFIVAVLCSATMKIFISMTGANLRLSNLANAIGEVKRVTRINGWQWMLLLSGFLFQQADRLIIASRLGSRDFAVYNFCWQVSFVVQSAAAASLVYILPIATRAMSQSTTSLRKSYMHDVKLGALMATVLAIVSIMVASIAFNTRMLPDSLRTGYPLFMIMAGCMYLSSLSVVPYYYLVALGWLPAIAIVNVLGAAMSFLTGLLAVGTFGVTGLALAKIWSVVTLSCYWFCHIQFRKRSASERQDDRAAALSGGSNVT